MKADIHPQDYRLVVFQDLNNDTSFLVKSTARTKETVKHEDGQTYPLVKLHVTSASHPFYTGQEKMIDIEGRIDKFQNRRQAAEKAQAQLKAKSLKALKKNEQAGQEREDRARTRKVAGERPAGRSDDKKSSRGAATAKAPKAKNKPDAVIENAPKSTAGKAETKE